MFTKILNRNFDRQIFWLLLISLILLVQLQTYVSAGSHAVVLETTACSDDNLAGEYLVPGCNRADYSFSLASSSVFGVAVADAITAWATPYHAAASVFTLRLAHFIRPPPFFS